MSNQVEIKIQKWLKDGVSHKQISKELMKGLLKGGFGRPFNDDEKKSSVFFPINAGFQKELYGQFSSWLKKKIFFPWGCFLKILSENNIDLETSILDGLFEGADRDKSLEVVSVSRNWDKQDPRFHYLRRQILEDRQVGLDRKMIEFKEKLEYFKLQRMLDEEKRVLNQFFRVFPKEIDMESRFRDYDFRWASHILTQSRFGPSFDRELINFDRTKNELFKKSLNVLKDHSMSYVKAQPDRVEDMAMMFLFMDEPQLALDIMNLDNHNNNWLRLELLFFSGRYFECLDELDAIEDYFAADPDVPFACSYLKAQVLWAVGQNELAINLLKNLVRVRPKYRSASSLLAKWNQN